MEQQASCAREEVRALAEVNQVEETVRCRLGTLVTELCVRFEGGGLVLRGRARTFYAKQLAQEEVMKQTDQPILANEIEVV